MDKLDKIIESKEYKFNLYNISYEKHELFHVTDYKYDKPNHDKILKNRVERSTHDNSVLGIWCSTLPALCSSFGKYTLNISLKENTNCLGFNYDDLYKLTHKSSLEEILRLKTYLLNFADVLYVLDRNRLIGEVIILNLDSVDNMIDVSDRNIKDKKISIDKLDIEHHLSFIL